MIKLFFFTNNIAHFFMSFMQYQARKAVKYDKIERG